MRVLLDNSKAFELAKSYPKHVGMFMGPVRMRDPKHLSYALDNGRFACWSHGKKWEETAFWKMLDRFSDEQWVVVPDSVGDAIATADMWQQWAPNLSGRTLALAVQDGMTPDSVKRLHPQPSVIFVGGTTQWKRQTIWQWCQQFPRVHVGRINTEKWLWNCARCGAESCDGTGWFRGDQLQLAGLYRFLDRYSRGLDHPQMQLEFARSFGGSVPETTYLR